MTADRFHWLISFLVLACFLLVASTVPAEAQKKQKAKPQQKTQVKETQKEEPKEEAKVEEEESAEKVEEVAPAPSQTAPLPNKFLDVIKQYVGKKTNLGILKKFAGDYMVFEDDLTTILVPVSNVQSVRLVRDDESSPANLEIKLISRD